MGMVSKASLRVPAIGVSKGNYRESQHFKGTPHSKIREKWRFDMASSEFGLVRLHPRLHLQGHFEPGKSKKRNAGLELWESRGFAKQDDKERWDCYKALQVGISVRVWTPKYGGGPCWMVGKEEPPILASTCGSFSCVDV